METWAPRTVAGRRRTLPPVTDGPLTLHLPDLWPQPLSTYDTELLTLCHPFSRGYGCTQPVQLPGQLWSRVAGSQENMEASTAGFLSLPNHPSPSVSDGQNSIGVDRAMPLIKSSLLSGVLAGTSHSDLEVSAGATLFLFNATKFEGGVFVGECSF